MIITTLPADRSPHDRHAICNSTLNSTTQFSPGESHE